jgi:hypothetical protein
MTAQLDHSVAQAGEADVDAARAQLSAAGDKALSEGDVTSVIYFGLTRALASPAGDGYEPHLLGATVIAAAHAPSSITKVLSELAEAAGQDYEGIRWALVRELAGASGHELDEVDKLGRAIGETP